MLFMGPWIVLDLFAQFKQSLEQVTEALAHCRGRPQPHGILLSATRGSKAMPPGMGHGPGSCERQQHLGAATSQVPQFTQHFAKPGP